MEWKFLAVRPETKEILNRLTGINGKFRGYKKYKVIKLALDVLDQT